MLPRGFTLAAVMLATGAFFKPEPPRSGPGRSTLYTAHKKAASSRIMPHMGKRERERAARRMARQ